MPGASLPDRLRKAADELESLRLAEDAALMREAAEALADWQTFREAAAKARSGPHIRQRVADGRVEREARP